VNCLSSSFHGFGLFRGSGESGVAGEEGYHSKVGRAEAWRKRTVAHYRGGGKIGRGAEESRAGV